MKKSLTFLMLMLCCIGVVFAKPVDSELAKKVALNFLKSTEKVAAADLTVEDFKDITATTPFYPRLFVEQPLRQRKYARKRPLVARHLRRTNIPNTDSRHRTQPRDLLPVA